MPNTSFPVLCGGTFFVLLSNSKKPSINKSKRMDGCCDAVTDPYLISRLIKITYENHYDVELNGSTAKTNTSQYKSCKINSSDWLCITDAGFIGQFEDRFKKEYTQLLINTNNFIKDCLEANTFKLSKLGRMILELVTLDETIPQDAKFYINLDGSFIEKKNISPTFQYSLQNLILGVWFYIVSNKLENGSGEKTYEIWHTPHNNNIERKFISDIGAGAFKDTAIQLLPDSDVHFIIDEKEPEPEAEEIDDNVSEEIEIDIKPEHENANNGSSAVFNNYGTVIEQVNGTVIINNNSGDKHE